MKYLLDTNICIYLIRKKPPQVLRKFNWKETIPRTAELNAPGTFRGRIIKAENIGKSSDELVAAEPDIDI